MKIFLLPLLFLAIGNIALAQSSKQVQWTYSAKKISDKVYEIHMTAAINGDYHLYAQHVGVDGPVPTTFTFTKNPLLTLQPGVKEVGKIVRKEEAVWKGTVSYFEKSVDFVQVVKLKGNAKTNLAGKVEFMVCNEKQCLPPADIDFNVSIGD